MWSCTTIPKSGGMGALPLSVVHSDDMLRLSATLIGNPVPASACKLVEQFAERVDHSTSDKKHDDPEHIIYMLLKVGYSLRSFPRLPHDGLEEKNNRNCRRNRRWAKRIRLPATVRVQPPGHGVFTGDISRSRGMGRCTVLRNCIC